MEQRKVVQFTQSRGRKTNKPKKRLKKKVQSFFFSLFIIIIVAVVFYFGSPLSKLSVVYFEGLNYVKRSELLELANISYDDYFLTLDLTQIKQNILTHPLVKEVKVEKEGFNNLKVQVVEKDVIACVQGESVLNYVLSDGTTIENLPGKKVNCQGMIISNLGEEPLEPAILKLFVKSVAQLDPIFFSIIKEVKYDPMYGDINRFSLFLTDGNTVNVNSYTMVGKLKYYQTMVEQVKLHYGDIKGVYHLDVGDHFQPYESEKSDLFLGESVEISEG